MSNSSPATYSRERDRSVRSSAGRSIFDNKRVSELVGFLLAVAGLLITLSLISHVAKDPSLNTATPSGAVTHNWVGPVGSYGSDLLYQGFGWIAYLLPLALFIVGISMFLMRRIEAPRTKAVGFLLLAGSLAVLFELFPYTPAIDGEMRGSGLAGYLLAAGLVDILNPVGAWIVAGTVFLASLFLVTRFSFSSAYDFLRIRLAFTQEFFTRFAAWREERRRKAQSRKAEKQKAKEAKEAAKGPVVVQRAAAPAAGS